MTTPDYKKRLSQLRGALKKQSLDALIVSCPENRRYLCGYSPEDPQLNESSGFLFVSRNKARLVTDPRYKVEAAALAPLVTSDIFTDGLDRLLPSIFKSLKATNIGVEAPFLSMANFQKMEQAGRESGLPINLVPTQDVVEGFRLIKDEDEVTAISEALAITEAAFAQVAAELESGQTEKEVAWRFEQATRRLGGDGLAFPSIIASGRNGAKPHAEPSDKVITPGEPIIFDVGVKKHGYCSDFSRTVILGDPDARFKQIYSLVRQAQQVAIAKIKPGMSTDQADALARDVITQGGFGDFFTHSLGHGVGLATHEAPGLSRRQPVPLRVGMVVTVEPGIYLEDWGGVRLEEMVLITKHGARLLNRDNTFYTFHPTEDRP
ncbi:MAG: aminopeptidase P family protein [Deltaproteobacteria bacterium]|nr:aminopeptidase P family protein [Deltaproteobacteria bacterium]